MKKILFLSLLAVTSCSNPPAPPPAPKSALEKTVAGLLSAPPCSAAIPHHWSWSWPIPVKERGAFAYKLFFYGRDGRPPAFVYHQPEGDAVFRPDGTIVSCAQRAQHGGSAPSANARYAGMTLEQIVERQRLTYFAIEDVAGLYAAGKPLNAEQKGRVAAFSEEFAFLTLPGHAPAYRALSPDFWSWVQKNGGAAPAAKSADQVPIKSAPGR